MISERDPSQKYWTSAILERMESDNFFWIAYYLIYLVKTLGPAQFWKELSLTIFFGKLTIRFTLYKHFLGKSGPERFWKELIPHSIPTFKILNICKNLLVEIYFSFVTCEKQSNFGKN
jgi:hypothetical protein